MFASFLSKGICPLFMRQREDEVFVEVNCGTVCGISKTSVAQLPVFSDHHQMPANNIWEDPSSFLYIVHFPVSGLQSLQRGNWYAAYKQKQHQIMTKAQSEEEKERRSGKTLLALEFSCKIQTSKMAKCVSVRKLQGWGGFFFGSSQLAALFRFSKDKVQKCPLGDIQNSI